MNQVNKTVYTEEDVNMGLIEEHAHDLNIRISEAIDKYASELQGSDKFNALIAAEAINDRLDPDTISEILQTYFTDQPSEYIDGANWSM